MRPTPCKDAGQVYGMGLQAMRDREMVRLEEVASGVARMYSAGAGFPTIARAIKSALTKMGYTYNALVELDHKPSRKKRPPNKGMYGNKESEVSE